MSATVSSDTDSAAFRTFAVSELLETILLQLRNVGQGEHWSTGIEDLFIVQRVCRTWHTAIKHSILLKRAMLLEHESPLPAPSGTKFGLEYLLDPYTSALKLHPAIPCLLKAKDNKSCFGKEQRLVQLAMSDRRAPGEVPMAGTTVGCLGAWTAWYEPYGGTLHDYRNIRCCKDLSSPEHERTIRLEGSWRQMKLLSSPRPLEVDILLRWVGWGRRWWKITIRLPGDATVGNLYYALVEISLRDRRAEEKIDWSTLDRSTLDTARAERKTNWVYMCESKGARDLIKKAFNSQTFHRYPNKGEAAAVLRMKAAHDEKVDCGVSRGHCGWCTAVADLLGDDMSDSDASRDTRKEAMRKFLTEAGNEDGGDTVPRQV